MSVLLIVSYIATIPAANWLIGHWGTVCVPNGPCLLPIFPGIMAPSGVLMIGAALVLRDLVQRRSGVLVSLACVMIGAALSAFIAPPALALASGAAFAFSELVDFAVYTPVARRSFLLAILLSCSAGALADSALFLWLAFGSLAFIGGQFVGKLYAAAAYLIVKAVVK
jgi:queuosine precursor transporter